MQDNNNQQPNQDTRDYFTPYAEGLRGLKDPSSVTAYWDRIRMLPPSLQSILKNFSTATWIEGSLGNEFILSREQKRAVARIIREVVTGEIPIEDMSNILVKAYDLNPQTSNDVVQRIQIQLFTPVLNEIKKIQREKFPQRAGQVSPSPAQQSPEINPGNVVDLRNNKTTDN